mgnify:CR=1 FL=1
MTLKTHIFILFVFFRFVSFLSWNRRTLKIWSILFAQLLTFDFSFSVSDFYPSLFLINLWFFSLSTQKSLIFSLSYFSLYLYIITLEIFLIWFIFSPLISPFFSFKIFLYFDWFFSCLFQGASLRFACYYLVSSITIEPAK